MQRIPYTISLVLLATLILAMSLVLIAGGAWLLMLGGSWYYVLAGLALLGTAVLLYRRRIAALWLYAALLLATLLWSLWEVGLDWWPIATRCSVLFVVGLLLLLPGVSGSLSFNTGARDDHQSGPAKRSGQGRTPLMAVLGVFVIVAGVSMLMDPHRIDGALAGASSGDAVRVASRDVPDEEWHAYGRTGFGQRYSPLDQITTANVDTLEVAWHYSTGDVRAPSDPEETTFQVTPLKIGDTLFLCTPHQSVIALNATTGDEIWRYDPSIQGELALQHLTCRGLSYFAGAPELQQDAPPRGQSSTSSGPDSDAQQDRTSTTPRSGAVGLEQKAHYTHQPVAAHADAATQDCQAMLFMPTVDGRIIAVNPKDGKVCSQFGNGTGQIDLWANMPHKRPGGYYSTSPAVVTDSLIIVGGTVLDNVSTEEPSGVIRAFDVRTGKLVWNWDSGNPDNTEPLAPGELYTPNSPNSWSISSVDEDLGMVYIPMANATPDQWGAERSDAFDTYASSVVALDLETGQVQWVFQTVRHDLWDYDVPSQPSLLDVTVQGESVPALVQPTKQGDIYVLDRRTGEPVLPVTEVSVPQGAEGDDFVTPTQPVSALSFNPEPVQEADMWGATLFDQLLCRIEFRQLRYEGRYTPPSTQGSLIYPGNFGVFNWGSIAVDPQREIAFATPAYLAFISRLVPRDDDTSLYVQDEQPPGSLPALNENFGAPYAVELSPFLSPLGLPCQQPPWGYVAGVDLSTGDIVWMHKNGTVRDSSPLPLPFKMGVPDLGGPVMTAGGVAFISGTLDYYVRAYDVSTGDELWKSRLPAGGQATPMTYVGEDGRQYLVVAAGGHGSLGTKAGDDVIAYALPDQ